MATEMLQPAVAAVVVAEVLQTVPVPLVAAESLLPAVVVVAKMLYAVPVVVPVVAAESLLPAVVVVVVVVVEVLQRHLTWELLLRLPTAQAPPLSAELPRSVAGAKIVARVDSDLILT